MTPAERALLLDVALAVRALLAEEMVGAMLTLTRRERVRQLDVKLEEFGIEHLKAPKEGV